MKVCKECVTPEVYEAIREIAEREYWQMKTRALEALTCI